MTKLNKVRIGIPHKVIAFMLVWAILLTSLPYRRSQAEDRATPDLNGIGIYNHILTEQSGLQTMYNLQFYQTKVYEVQPAQGDTPAVMGEKYVPFVLGEEFLLHDTSGNAVYLESDGKMLLEQNQIVKFTETATPAFRQFLIDHKITRISFNVECHQMRDGQDAEVYKQYPSPNESVPSAEQIYDIEYDSETNLIVAESSYDVKQYDLTPIVDYDVHVQWRDTNNRRPDSTNVLFDITRTQPEHESESYISAVPQQSGETHSASYGGTYAGTDPAESVHRTITEIDSNHILYTYGVPECASDGSKYTYETVRASIVPDENADNNYYILKEDSNSFTNYHLTDFSCKVNWKDYAHNDLNKQITPAFIRSHFEFLDETIEDHPYNAFIVNQATLNEEWFPEETRSFIEANYDYDEATGCYVMKDDHIRYVTEEDGTTKIVIDGLQEITADGTAKTYALKPMTETIVGQEVIKPIPVHQVAAVDFEQAESLYTGASVDGYIPSATNTGVRSNVVDKVYDGAELNLLLTGKTTFEGDLRWADNAKASERIAAVDNGTAGDFMLYRYVDTGNNVSDSQMVSQVGIWKIDAGGRYI